MAGWRWLMGVLGFVLSTGLAAESFDAVLGQGQRYLQQGQYKLAMETLKAAVDQAGSAEQRAQAQGALGLVYYQMHRFEPAEPLLRQAITTGAGPTADRARWTAAVAAMAAESGQTAEARRRYDEALKLAHGDPPLLLGIRLGQVRLLPKEQRLDQLQTLQGLIQASTPPAARARFLLNSASQAQALGAVPLAYAQFDQARQDAAGEPRLLAEALGGLAQLYEDQHRTEEALRLNREAIAAAQSANARDLLIDLEWRLGRLHRLLGQKPEALAAYQRAVDHIEAIRLDIPVEYHDGRSSFRDTLEPVYLGLADLLLEQAGGETGEAKTRTLRRARAAVELIKQTELEDFLGGRCTVQGAKGALLDTVEARTAILYPILLRDRLELLVSIGSEVRQFTQPVGADQVQEAARQFAEKLRSGPTGGEDLGRQLFRWLVAPVEPWLHEQSVQTLVVVPDGALRLIPLAALSDGQHYLIEQYALATSPGLTLFEPKPLHQGGMNSLLAGMSEPGPVLDHLPPVFLETLAGNRGRGVGPELPHSRALPMSLAGNLPPPDKTRSLELERLLREPGFQERLKHELSLPGVAEELAAVKEEVPNRLLLNADFTVENFQRQLVQAPYQVVHIASHGVFGKTADTSFIMAYDNLIHMDDLEKLLHAEKFAKQPVELLTLSACQTAEGDDRAPLGLAGVALKAKVRSALGTLWPVADEAAAQLMAAFYENLKQPGISKATALRQAQLTLLHQRRLAHPFYWSPFILVGNWL